MVSPLGDSQPAKGMNHGAGSKSPAFPVLCYGSTSQDEERALVPQDDGSSSRRRLLGGLLALAVGGVFDVVVAVHRNIEQVSIGIHGAVFGERPRRGPLRHWLFP